MSLLLDTHVFLWWLMDDPRLPEETRRSIAEPRTAVHISAATIWEISIKAGLGKIELGKSNLAEAIESNDFLELPIKARHAWLAGRLPPHHKDPFDRMLVAQAQVEHLVIITYDRNFQLYDVSLLLT
ncbi:type II toxin-antitoxin system VapC family toxin [Acidobacteria bacterium AH-259-O06]|nr:type II toxin-antitoxin system VapC family toxin [Acidobacteria bacterium AH-259-O06]